MIKTIIDRYLVVYILAILVIIIGVWAYITLPRESSPEIKQPFIFVTTVYAGVAPKDIESLVTQPIEEEIEGIEGVKKITSVSRQNVSQITVEFTSDVTVETALRRVKERVETVGPELPADAEDPDVQELASSDWPIFIAMVSHPDGSERIDAQVRLLRDRLKRVPGVLDVVSAGTVEREIAIELDPVKLQHYGLAIDDVADAVRGEHSAIPGGVLRTPSKDYSIAVTGEIKDPSLFRDIMVQVDDVSIRLADIASVSFAVAEPDTYSRINGQPAISLEVKKRTGQNILGVVDLAKAEIEKSLDEFPVGTKITYSYDQARYVRDMIADLENNMATAFLLVLGVTVFFLGFRNSFFVALAIPFSMLISFFVLQRMGITLNMMVLFSLILALGMLVDNGIVIVENIFRHAAMGKGRVEAAADGVAEVAAPVASSTLTTILAFFPIIFMPGVMGDFMAYLPKTVIVVLASSLLVAMTINPVFCARMMNISEKTRRQMVEGSGAFVRVQGFYEKALRAVVRRPVRFTLATFLIVIGGIVTYGIVGKEPIFFPAQDPQTAVVKLEARQGTPLDHTDSMVRRIEALIPGIPSSLEHYQITTGNPSGEEHHEAEIRIEYKPFREREVSGAVGIENLKAALEGFTGADLRLEELEMGPPSGYPISYAIEGQDYLQLGQIAHKIIDIIQEYPELKGIDTDYEPAKPELAVEIDRKKAAFFGLSTAQIASTIRNAVYGETVGSFREGDEEYDIVVRYKREFRDSLSHIRDLQVVGRDGERIAVQNVADIGYRSSVGVIKRKDLKRSVEVWADFKEDVQNKAEVTADIARRVAEIGVPAGYFIGKGEGLEIQDESSVFLVQAFAIALFLILVVLIVQFNSLFDAAIIVSSVFLSLGGVFWGYALTGQVFVVIMSGIGCISLAGVVVNNCIVLVDYTNVLVKRGTHWREAVVQSGRTRLRPVLLTAITTVLGLLPMGLGVSIDFHQFALQIGSEQAEFWKAFAWAMIFGLSFATLTTLVVVPTLLTIKFRLRDRLLRRKRVPIETLTAGIREEEARSPALN